MNRLDLHIAPYHRILIACVLIAAATVTATAVAAMPSAHTPAMPSAITGCIAGAQGNDRHHPVARCAAVSKLTTALPATIAGTLATTCQNTRAMPTPKDIEAVREAILCLVNQERARNGEMPLRPNTALDRAAQQHSDEMVSADYFAHVAPDGETPLQRIERDGYIPNGNVGYVIGENIAWGTLGLATPEAIVRAWIASPGHLANILDRQYVETGVGVAPSGLPSRSEGNPGGIYSQEFGAIIR